VIARHRQGAAIDRGHEPRGRILPVRVEVAHAGRALWRQGVATAATTGQPVTSRRAERLPIRSHNANQRDDAADQQDVLEACRECRARGESDGATSLRGSDCTTAPSCPFVSEALSCAACTPMFLEGTVIGLGVSRCVSCRAHASIHIWSATFLEVAARHALTRHGGSLSDGFRGASRGCGD
jgi:hypothetical protein